jgi:BMFP domain-containing protein YqiC
MSQNKNFLDEINKLAGSALSSAMQAKDTICEFIKEHIDSLVKSKDIVSRDEFEALKSRVDKLQSQIKSANKNLKPKKKLED